MGSLSEALLVILQERGGKSQRNKGYWVVPLGSCSLQSGF